MAENIVVNDVVYNGVDSISMQNENGENVPFYPDAVRYNAQTLTEEQKAQARANIGAQAAAKKETVTVLSDNLFDKSTAVSGKSIYASSSGPQIQDKSDFSYAYVPLRGAGVYRSKVSKRNRGESYAARVPILREDLTFIQNVTGTLTATDDDRAWDVEFTITQEMLDAGAAIYAFDLHTVFLDTMMIVKDREYPTEYIPYGYIEVETDVDTSVDVTVKLDNPLHKKTAVFLGDSLCAGDVDGSEYDGYGWAGLIGEANGMTWKNYGRNGGTITPIESVVAESRDLSSQVNIAKAEFPNADFVIFEGGGNDAYQLEETGLGEISDDFATFDTSTFSGAMESLILKILNEFPNAQVGYIVATKMNNPPYTSAGNIVRKYFDRAVEICQKWGIPAIDLWNGGFLNPALLYHAENFYTDRQHLTLAGYQRISPQIEAWMRNLTVPGVVSGGGGGNSAPADWNAADGEPGHVLNRTHCKCWVNVIPDTEMVDSGEGMFVAELTADVDPFALHRVNYNDTIYECMPIVTGLGSSMKPMFGMGNLGMMGMGEDTGEPFVVAGGDGALVLMPFDGATSVTISIDEQKTEELAKDYYVSTYFVDVTVADDVYTTTATLADVYKALKKGCNIIARVTGSFGNVEFLQLASTSNVIPAIMIFYGRYRTAGLKHLTLSLTEEQYSGVNWNEAVYSCEYSEKTF